MPPETITKKRPGRKPVITPQRKQLILNFIHEYRRKQEKNPTYTEITKGIGYSNTAEGTVFTLVEALIQEGWLRKVGEGSRSVMPVFPPDKIYSKITDPLLKDIQKRQRDLRILRRL